MLGYEVYGEIERHGIGPGRMRNSRTVCFCCQLVESGVNRLVVLIVGFWRTHIRFGRVHVF